MKVYLVRQADDQGATVEHVAASAEIARAWRESRKVCPHPAGYHPPPWSPTYTLDACLTAIGLMVDDEMYVDEWDVDEGPTP